MIEGIWPVTARQFGVYLPAKQFWKFAGKKTEKSH